MAERGAACDNQNHCRRLNAAPAFICQFLWVSSKCISRSRLRELVFMCWQCNLEWFLCRCYFDKLVGSIFVIRGPFSSSHHLHTNQRISPSELPSNPHALSIAISFFANLFICFSFSAHTFGYIRFLHRMPEHPDIQNGTRWDRFFHSINSISIFPFVWCAHRPLHFNELIRNTNYF